MKLNKNFITHQSDDKQIMISMDNEKFSGMIRSNETAAYIIDMLKEDTTREEIIAKMLNEYNASEELISSDVDKVLSSIFCSSLSILSQ